MTDIYYDPDHYGLDLIWTAEYDEPYQFDIVAAWGSKATGAVFLGRDSGCSCPSPFEDFTKPDDVNRLTRVDPQRGRNEIRRAILGVMKDGGDWSRHYYPYNADEAPTKADQRGASTEGADKILAWSQGRIPAVTA